MKSAREFNANRPPQEDPQALAQLSNLLIAGVTLSRRAGRASGATVLALRSIKDREYERINWNDVCHIAYDSFYFGASQLMAQIFMSRDIPGVFGVPLAIAQNREHLGKVPSSRRYIIYASALPHRDDFLSNYIWDPQRVLLSWFRPSQRESDGMNYDIITGVTQ